MQLWWFYIIIRGVHIINANGRTLLQYMFVLWDQNQVLSFYCNYESNLKMVLFMYVNNECFSFDNFFIMVIKKNAAWITQMLFLGKKWKNHNIDEFLLVVRISRNFWNFHFTIKPLAKFGYFLSWMIVSPPISKNGKGKPKKKYHL